MVQQGQIADLVEDERYRLTGDLYARMQECIRCYCLGEICDAHPTSTPVVWIGPRPWRKDRTKDALVWSVKWLGLITIVAMLVLFGGMDVG